MERVPEDKARTLNDGLGVRRLATDPLDGTLVEVLEITPALAAREGFEAALRTRAGRLSNLSIERLAAVRRIERDGGVLRVIADHAPGLRLPDLLREAQRGDVMWSPEAAAALSAQIVRVVAALHGTARLSHGAITPAHIVVSRKGTVTLTDGIFGPGLELLNSNRHHVWREFGVALPPSRQRISRSVARTAGARSCRARPASARRRGVPASGRVANRRCAESGRRSGV